MKSNVLEKSISSSVASRFFDDLMDWQNLCGCGMISLKAILIFLKIFLISSPIQLNINNQKDLLREFKFFYH